MTKFRQAQEQWWFCECSWVFISARLPSCPAGHILSLLSRVPPTYSNITAMIRNDLHHHAVLSLFCVLFSFLFFFHSNSLSHCLFLSLLSWHVSSSASITDNQREACTVLCEMRFRTIHVEAIQRCLEGQTKSTKRLRDKCSWKSQNEVCEEHMCLMAYVNW